MNVGETLTCCGCVVGVGPKAKVCAGCRCHDVWKFVHGKKKRKTKPEATS